MGAERWTRYGWVEWPVHSTHSTIKDAGITDVGAFFHVEDPGEIATWNPAIARVEPRGYLTGYHPWDKSWGAFNHLLARFGDGTGLTRMIGIDFAE